MTETETQGRRLPLWSDRVEARLAQLERNQRQLLQLVVILFLLTIALASLIVVFH